MNDERCDRDRVTAIETAIAKQLERDYYPVAPAIAKSVMRTPALLEALDTIDRLEGELSNARPWVPRGSVRGGHYNAQALNGGNE